MGITYDDTVMSYAAFLCFHWVKLDGNNLIQTTPKGTNRDRCLNIYNIYNIIYYIPYYVKLTFRSHRNSNLF